MLLSVGYKLGHYEVLSLLGQGGMGEVYRAKDTKLDRDVAIKVLPQELARDPERLARFEREAKVLASLDHPNIGHIHGILDSEDSRGLVLALVEGPTLADRIEAGPILLDEAIGIVKQIIEALEYAHDRGVVHRDLKPANVKITAEGAVKVLDFGLAKVLEDEPAVSSMANSPTLTLGHTRAGVILGTAAYMSPEQAVGRTVDRRSDIFSFGAVLYEMLSGKRAFLGAATPDVLEAVVKNDPDWSALPAGTPAYVRRLLERTLAKDRKQRLQAIGEARIALENPRADESPASPVYAASPPRLRWFWPGVSALLALVAAALSFLHFREKPPAPPQLTRFTIPVPENGNLGQYLAISPDGRRVTFIFSGQGGTRLWVRALDSLQSHPLTGTEGVAGVPFWSFDSRNIVFWTGGKLKKIDAAGGPPQTLCDVPANIMRGFWSRDNRVVFGSATGVYQVASGGGVASPLTKLDPARQEIYHGVPALLPDARHFVFQRYAPGSPDTGGVYLASLDTKPEAQGLKRIVPDQSMPAYTPSLDPASPNAGYLLFVREATLMAQPFDAGRLELSGDPVAIAEQIGSFGAYSVSETGTLVYGTGASGMRSLTWYDRQGKAIGTAAPPSGYLELSLSQAGSHVAAATVKGGAPDIWVYDLARGASTRLTNGPGRNARPVWSPDGKRIVFSSDRGGVYQLITKPASGAGDERVLRTSKLTIFANDWSHDGRLLLFEETDAKRKNHVWYLSMDGEPKPTQYLQDEFNERAGQFSPDHKFVAYVSDQSGGNEVYVSSFPDANALRVPISHGGGTQPRWRQDGKELLYFSGDGNLMSVDVTLAPIFKAGVPKVLFKAPIFEGGLNGGSAENWDVSPDGQRFLLNILGGGSAPLTVELNWQAGLKK